MSAPTAASSFFRVAGLSYNQYSAVALRALHKVLKPDAAKTRKFDVEMKERVYQAGKTLPRSK